jgi:hypothetical protein
MPAKILQFTSWSFSRWLDYDRCPAQACYKHLQKVRTEQMAKREEDERTGKVDESPMARGSRIDDATNKFLSKRTAKIPIELMPMAPVYRKIRSLGNLSINQSWGFTKNWEPCSSTDWDNCWLRAKIDVCWIAETKAEDVLHIKDNKTGKFRPNKNEEYLHQLNLYGTVGLAYMPTVAKVTTQLLYSDLNLAYPKEPTVFTRAQLATMQKHWEKLVKPMFNDRRFAPKPGYYCTYCDFSKSKGGPCRY